MSPRIAESELILNARGAVYHLDLTPDELGPLVITVGDPGRVPVVSQHFDRVEHRSAHREFLAHTGRLGGRALTVLSTGIGPDNIDIVLNELDALANIDLGTRRPKPAHTALTIIRLGTCGGLQPDIPTDGLIVSTHGLGLDNLLHFYGWTPAEGDAALLEAFAGHTGTDTRHIVPYLAAGDAGWLQRFRDAGFHSGITVTCPGFYAPQGRRLRLAPALEDLPGRLSSFRHEGQRITNFEMETSAIYGLGGMLGHRCLSVNTVVANRSTGQFSADAPAAIARMITQALEVIMSAPGD